MKKNIRRHLTTLVFALAIVTYYDQPRKVDWFFRTCVSMLVTVFVIRIYTRHFPGTLTMRGRIHYFYVATHCFHCGRKLSFWRRLHPHDYGDFGGKDYCSSRCRSISIQHINDLALERLTGFKAPKTEPVETFYTDPWGNVQRRLGLLPGARPGTNGIPVPGKDY